MKFNLREASIKHRDEIMKESEEQKWDNDILLYFLVLASSVDTHMSSKIADRSEKKGLLDVKLLVNDVEMDLNKGLTRIIGFLNNKSD